MPDTRQCAALVEKASWLTLLLYWLLRRSGSPEVARALLEGVPRGRHPSVRDRNKRGLTPLGEALALGRGDMAQLLVAQVCSFTLHNTPQAGEHQVNVSEPY